MPVLVFGFIVLILALSMRCVPTLSLYSRTGTYTAILLLVLGIVISSFVQIDAGPGGGKKTFW